jgi:Superinfection immunity protein
MFCLLTCGLLYFLPSIVGHRKQPFAGIFILNLLAGWTVIGWIIAMVWALTAEEQHRVFAVVGPARFCSRCGASSAGVGSYCWNCGSRI